MFVWRIGEAIPVKGSLHRSGRKIWYGLMDREVSPGGGDTLALLRPLDAAEVRLLADAQLSDLRDFARSDRLHAVDGKSDTPLHIAARCGKLALCDLLIQHGADPNAKNAHGQTASEVAYAEGHLGLSQLLQALETIDETAIVVAQAVQLVTPSPPEIKVPDFDWGFEAEADPEAYRPTSTKGFDEPDQAPFSPYSVSTTTIGEVDWTLDLGSAAVEGDGINVAAAATAAEAPADDEFLITQMRGKRSRKTATLPVGTRMSVDETHVRQVMEQLLDSHRVQAADVEALVTACWGNADEDDSWRNVVGILTAAGLEMLDNDDPSLWDSPVAVDAEDLAEAIASALTRNVRLPGRGRFKMDRSDQELLLDPMLHAKDGLHLALVASREAVRVILRFVDMVLEGQLKPEFFTLLAVYPSRDDDPGSAVLRDVSATLRSVTTEDAVIEGKRRRLAIQGIEQLDLSSIFFKALGRHLSAQPGQEAIAKNIHELIEQVESITARLIDAHLPYARRFASRYCEEGEDLEDVFQIAFMGLQKATRRFDPERGTPFSLYATAWMRQTLTRWRSDEKAMIRIPVHRHSDIASLDEALERLSMQLGRTPTTSELAADREWSVGHVDKLLLTPRAQVEWEELGPEWLAIPPLQEEHVDQAQTAEVVAEALSELDPRQADILRKRFGFESGGEMTLEEVGQIYGVTRERIRQIEAKALRFLSNAARVRRLRALVGM